MSVARTIRRARVRELLIGDMFCGAGGSSLGARRALERRGLRMRLACINHCQVAIETHKRNHPDAEHFCADVYRTPPRRAVPGGRLDLLMASPTCTYFSRARGGKPISRDQRWGRMTPTQVLRWITELDVRVLLVENVPEFVDWGPVHPGPVLAEDGTVLKAAPPISDPRCARRCKPGKPCRRRAGYYFRPWVRRIEALGYQVEWRILNAADYGDATTRRRLFMIARKDGEPIVWPTPSHSKDGNPDLFGGGAERWRAAREIIDWSLEGRSIFGRKHPLSPKTMARIYAGAVKFGWPEPFLVVLRRHMDGQSLDDPLPTVCAGGTHLGLAQPIVFQVNQGGDRVRNIRPADQPLQTVVTRPSLGMAQPLVVRSDMHKSNALCVRSADEPIPTATTRGGIGVAEPVLLPQRDSNAPRAAGADPVPGITTTSRGIGLAQPFLFGNRTNNVPKAPEEPTPGLTTAHGGGVGLVEPFLSPYHGDIAGSPCPSRSLDAPLPTQDTSNRFGLVEPLVLPQGGGGVARPATEPVPTIATDGAVALIAPYYGQSEPRPASDPLGTITCRDRFGLVVPVTHHDASGRSRSLEDPLPTITGAHRGELAFIAAAFGEREGQTPRVHSVEEPTPAILATGRVQLVEGYELDIRFRMLQPDELARAMGFDGDEPYDFAGTKEEITRQIGNAVPVRTAAALVDAIVGSMSVTPAPRRRKARVA